MITLEIYLAIIVLMLCISVFLCLTCSLATKSLFWQKIYAFLFAHEKYKIYKNVLNMIKNGKKIHILPLTYIVTNTQYTENLAIDTPYILLVFPNKKITLFEHNNSNMPILSSFWDHLIMDIIKHENVDLQKLECIYELEQESKDMGLSSFLKKYFNDIKNDITADDFMHQYISQKH